MRGVIEDGFNVGDIDTAFQRCDPCGESPQGGPEVVVGGEPDPGAVLDPRERGPSGLEGC